MRNLAVSQGIYYTDDGRLFYYDYQNWKQPNKSYFVADPKGFGSIVVHIAKQ